MLGFIIAAIVIIAVIIGINAPKWFNPNRIYEKYPETPKDLGLRKASKLLLTVDRLEASFDADFTARLKYRVMQTHPKMKDAEFMWRLFELKRYLMLTAVLKQVPMFSTKVDDVWHEMLMFTREYSTICDHVAGQFIHHAPHTETVSMPHERAWFDWVYHQVFTGTPPSRHMYRGFFQNPLDPRLLQDFRNKTVSELIEKYFNSQAVTRYPDVAKGVQHLIETLQNQIKRADQEMRETSVKEYVNHMADRVRRRQWEDDLPLMLATSSVYLSLYAQDDYAEHMMLLDRAKQADSSSASNCGGYVSGNSSHDSCDSSDGSSDSGSSCSSCGGGGD
ncbi:hypothetical protein [Brevibacillus dissolubilis]|uniref:hypothetical protein n=1 Tax=Brevibacillus dissolubilis TaxID=1844116 RepID=UPI0011171EDC|nr:hypothetical protein [Brevibacillus dissolubilis]